MTKGVGGANPDRKLSKAEIKGYIKDQFKVKPVQQAKAQARKMGMKIAKKARGG